MNEVEIHRVDLPTEMLDAQVRELVRGGEMLAAEVLRYWSVGRIWTGVRSGVEVNELINLTRGGLREPARLNSLVLSFMTEFLREDRSSLAIFEDAVARAGDPVLKHAKSAYILIEEMVYPVLRGGKVSEGEVRNLLLDAWSWRLLGVLTHSSEPSSDHYISESLGELVEHSRHVVLGAWDGEGLIVIDRARGPIHPH